MVKFLDKKRNFAPRIDTNFFKNNKNAQCHEP